MNYLTYGNNQDNAIVFIHGMASTALLCYEPILKYFEKYYVVLVEVDGHSSNTKGDLTNLKDSCDDIEKYIIENLDGHIYGLCGFSMGATMAVELIGRGNISVDKAVLDAAFTVKMGLSNYKNPVLFLRGSREPYPKKSATILKKYIPHLEEKVLKGMGHGQYLHEHPSEYANELLFFLSEKNN